MPPELSRRMSIENRVHPLRFSLPLSALTSGSASIFESRNLSRGALESEK